MKTRALVLAAFVLALTGPAAAQSRSSRRFQQTSKLSDPRRLKQRLGVAAGRHYRIREVEFRLSLPKGFDHKKTYGLVVWVSPSDRGEAPRAWSRALSRRGYIAIGADSGGNERPLARRVALALDAAHNARQAYTIDPERIVVAGFSGGGRVASLLGFCFPDVFRGGLYLAGADYHRQVRIPRGPSKSWPPLFPKPAPGLFDSARRDSRHVFMAGSRDPARHLSRAIRDAARADSFAATRFIEVPQLGHAVPSGKWLDKALTFIEAG